MYKVQTNTPFHLVLQILCNEFLNPQKFVIRPPLGVEGEHYPAGEIGCFAERFLRFVNIPAGQGQVFAMVADFMAEDARWLLHVGGCE
jgi:hypothetical protein